MSKYFKILIIAIVFIIVLFLSGGVLNKIANLPCDNKVILKVASPDNLYFASIVKVDCGATTDFAQHIILRDASLIPYTSEKTICIIRGLGIKHLIWRDNHTLVVEFNTTDSLFFQQDFKWKNINIIYRSL